MAVEMHWGLLYHFFSKKIMTMRIIFSPLRYEKQLPQRLKGTN